MENILKQYKQLFLSAMSDYIKHLDGAEQPIADACKYALEGGGKRLRPILCYLGADIMAKEPSYVNNIALAVEMIHNYSLAHDDLPCMDDDQLRHGRACTHVQFGEGMGVLAGDALLNMAMEAILAHDNIDKQYIDAMKIVFRNSGIHGMIGGQCIDLVSEGKNISIKEIIRLNELKTSALFKASLVGSAVACGANKAQQSALEKFCDRLGLIFQIVDDILDITSTTEQLGKNVGSDITEQKATYLSQVGMNVAKDDILRYEQEAIECLKIFGDKADTLISLTKYLTNRTH